MSRWAVGQYVIIYEEWFRIVHIGGGWVYPDSLHGRFSAETGLLDACRNAQDTRQVFASLEAFEQHEILGRVRAEVCYAIRTKSDSLTRDTCFAVLRDVGVEVGDIPLPVCIERLDAEQKEFHK